MNCKPDIDCVNIGLTCDKNGSESFCSACALPRSRYYIVFTVASIIAIAIITLTIWYATKPVKFIASATFCSAKKGYVFKTENGQTGYYLDTK